MSPPTGRPRFLAAPPPAVVRDLPEPAAPTGKAFKRAVRARMAATGEPYTAARRALLQQRAATDGGAR